MNLEKQSNSYFLVVMIFDASLLLSKENEKVPEENSRNDFFTTDKSPNVRFKFLLFKSFMLKQWVQCGH